jgi:phosphatidylglycerol:prolipoprotein diacylglycerol transferase
MRFSLYGLLVGLAVAVVWLLVENLLRNQTRAKSWPESTWTAGFAMLLVGTLVGARAYHVITDWPMYSAFPWPAVVQVWKGGLGWYGGLIGMAIALFFWRRIQKPQLRWGELIDAFALALPWGQALGRWGNYFNQEIFGPPTSMPWGVFIDPALRPPEWAQAERFHPLFLYESLGTLAIGIGLALLWRWSQNKSRELPWLRFGSGTYFALYGLSFGVLRFALDLLRTDLSFVGVLTVSQIFSLLLIGVCLITLQRNLGIWLRGLAAILVGTGLLLSSLAAPWSVQAQSARAPIDLSLTPAVVEVVIQPGKSVTRAFTLKNQGTTDLNATLTLRDFVSDHSSGSPVLLEESKFPYASLANSDRRLGEAFPLPAGGEQQIVLQLNIPEDSLQQDWYVVLLASTEPQQRDPLISSRASSQGAIGAALMVRISETEEIPLQWGVTFPKLPRFMDSLRPLTIEPLVENLNPTLAIPTLTVSVRNWRGELVHTQEGLPERVLSRSTRFIRAQKVSEDDPRSMEPVPFVFDPLFALGPYTVIAQISNQAGQPLVVEQKVWALPISLIVATGILLSTLLVLPRLRRRGTSVKKS